MQDLFLPRPILVCAAYLYDEHLPFPKITSTKRPQLQQHVPRSVFVSVHPKQLKNETTRVCALLLTTILPAQTVRQANVARTSAKTS